MFVRYPDIPWNLSAVCAVVLVLAAVSLPAGPAHGFGLKSAAAPAAGVAKDADGNKKPGARQVFEEEVDRATGKLVDKAADKIEEYTIKAGKKAYGWLEKTKRFGPLAKKIAMRYGPIVAKGLRFSGPAGTTWEVAYQAGDKVIAPFIAIPLMDRHFDNKWEKQQAELSREIADLRNLGEERRQWRERKNDFASLMAGALAVRKLTEDGRGPWAQDTTEDSNPAGSGKTAWDAETPAAGKDPWVSESPDVRFARPVAVKTAPVPVKDVETGPSNYEKALNSLQGGGTRSAGYKGALEKLEADRRAEQARKQSEAEAARQRQAARAAAERRPAGGTRRGAPGRRRSGEGHAAGSGTRSPRTARVQQAQLQQQPAATEPEYADVAANPATAAASLPTTEGPGSPAPAPATAGAGAQTANLRATAEARAADLWQDPAKEMRKKHP